MMGVEERVRRAAKRGARASRARMAGLRATRRLQVPSGDRTSKGPSSSTGAPVPRRAHLPALDGLRGIGIAAVVVYHLDRSWLPGGYLGVDVFFVISGFLITGLLLDLLAAAGPISHKLRDFWARRARRLLPALVAVAVVITLACAVLAHDAVPRLRADIPSALGFVANWRLLLHKDSYFESMGRPPLLLHLWSLGVEEQFYLFWPWVVLLVLRFTRRPTRALCWVAGLGAVVSALLMGLLFAPGHDPSSVYYDTFTHSGGLMLGAALAAGVRDRWYVPARLRRAAGGGAPADLSTPVPARPGAPRARRWETGVGVVALAGIAVLIALMTDQGTFTYRGGIFLGSALTAVVIWALLRRGPFARALSARPLRYLGTRSYSLYLWHWPVICLTRPNLDVALSGAPLLVLRLGLMAGLAEGSYRFVEQPFRTGRAQAAFRALHGAVKRAVAGSAGLAGATVVALLVLVNPPALPAALAQGSTPAARVRLLPAGQPGGSGGGGPSPATGGGRPTRAQVVSATSSTTTRARVSGPGGSASSPGATVPTTPVPTTPVPTTPVRTAPVPTTPVPTTPVRTAPVPTTPVRTTPASTTPLVTRPSTAPGSSPPPSSVPPSTAPAQAASKLGHSVLAIGDSVLLAAASALGTRLHGDITVDAAVGRQVWTGISRLEQYRDAGDLVGLKAIVIALGTNGPMTPSDVAQLRALARGVPLLVFINVRVNRTWQSKTNTSLAAVVGQPGVRVVNWYAASATPGLLWPDGVHPDPAGATVYADLVASALALSAPAPERPGPATRTRARGTPATGAPA